MIKKRVLFPVTLLALAWTVTLIEAQQPAGSVQDATPAVSTPHTNLTPSSSSVPHTVLRQAKPPAPEVLPQPAEASPAQQPQIIVTSPAPAIPPWQWYERVAWGASIVLAVLGYVGILLALRTLKNIERNGQSSLEAARAAVTAAECTLSQTKAILEFERPWILVSVEPYLTAENSFKIMASNRGRRPARITHLSDQVHIVTEEAQLPKTPGHDSVEPQMQEEPLILLPGESLAIARFSRNDVAQICKTDDQLRRIASWEEIIFLFGRITYHELTGPADQQPHLTDWCCRYIHGETKSALLVGGPPGYHRHT